LCPHRFSEELLDCCVPLRRVKKDGVSIDEAACLARCNGAHCELYRPPSVLWRDESVASYVKLQAEQLDADALSEWVDQFRSAVRDSCRNSNGPRIIVAYDRRSVAQVGSGHFSPIGGYHEQSDQALVLDVARFKYPPHWVPLADLARAMIIKDSTTQKSRGYLLVMRKSDDSRAPPPAVQYAKWKTTALSVLEKFETATMTNDDSFDDVVVRVGRALVDEKQVRELHELYMILFSEVAAEVRSKVE
jgi:glutathione gamma-glutamylcysteinyltransferase